MLDKLQAIMQLTVNTWIIILYNLKIKLLKNTQLGQQRLLNLWQTQQTKMILKINDMDDMKTSLATILMGFIAVGISYLTEINEFLNFLVLIGTLILISFKIVEWFKKRNK